MRKFVIIFLFFVFSSLFLAILVSYDRIQKENKAIESIVIKLNKRVKYLHDVEGYTWEASHKIVETEAGLIPEDEEYKSLKED